MLYSPSGSKWFASRHAFKRLKYRSQSQSAYDRACKKLHRLQNMLDEDDDYYLKPKGMHWKTFDKIMEQMDQADEICDYHFSQKIAVLLAGF